MYNVSEDALLPLNLCTDVGLGIYVLFCFQRTGDHSFPVTKFSTQQNILECIVLGAANVNKLVHVYCLVRNLTFAGINCSSPHTAGIAGEE